MRDASPSLFSPQIADPPQGGTVTALGREGLADEEDGEDAGAHDGEDRDRAEPP
jgi:hypothetical protein